MLYFAALAFLILASYAHAKSSGSFGARPAEGSAAGLAFDLFGGALAPLAVVGLIGWGMYAISWWQPIAAAFAAALCVGFLYSMLRGLGATIVLIACPVGLAMGGYVLAMWH